jgi:hypothetical protein
MQPMSFTDMSASFGPPPPPTVTEVHIDLFDELPDAVIDALVAADDVPTVEVRHWGGAIARPGADAGPVGHRDVPLSVIVDAPSARVAGALAPYATGGSFLNFLSDTARTETAYTAANWRRLRALKRAYDPDGVFSAGHAIPPAEAARGAAPGARLRW